MATDELRLLWAMGLCGLPLAAGWRVARRSQNAFEAWGDAILIGYGVQYISVGVAGLLGILTPIWLTVICVGLCTALWNLAGRVEGDEKASALSSVERRWMQGACLGALGFVAALAFQVRYEPPMVTDALTYHLPAAVYWLQLKRLAIFQTWFFNPANTFSPLGGSMFAAWLMAPVGNDSLVRFMQIGPWMLIVFAAMNLARSAGARAPAAALLALTAAVSRPFVSQSVIVKDDLFVTAFFLVAVGGLTAGRCKGWPGALRVGVAVGLMLSLKITAMMAIPMLLLGVDAPFRAKWRWREWICAAGCVALLAGPWYLRNWIEFGNPLFPVRVHFFGVSLPGLMSSIYVNELRTAKSVWGILTGGYFGMPAVLFVFLWVLWAVAVWRGRKMIIADPLQRMVLVGPPVGLVVYVAFSPQSEVRFLYPAFALLFVASGIALAGGRAIAVAAVVATLAVCTSFVAAAEHQIGLFAATGAILAGVGILVQWLEGNMWRLRRPIASWSCVGAVLIFVCVTWHSYLREYRDGRFDFWETSYAPYGSAWKFVDENVPGDATIAYTNQFMIYPLYGFDLRRHVVYAPARKGAWVGNQIFPDRMNGAEFFNASMHAANFPADRAAWMENLRAAAAKYLFIEAEVGAPEIGPEVAWAAGDPGEFRLVYRDESAVVYEIRQ